MFESFYTAIFKKKITRKLITHVKIVFEVSRIFRSFSSRVAHSSPHHGLSIVVSLDLFLRGGFIWTLDFLNNVILPFGFVNVIQYSEMMTQSRIIHTPLRTLIHTHTNLGGGWVQWLEDIEITLNCSKGQVIYVQWYSGLICIFWFSDFCPPGHILWKQTKFQFF